MLCRLKTYSITANDLTIADSYAEHITTIHESKMFANGIHPDKAGILWVADRNMARNALCVAMASPVAEHGGHV